MEQVGDYWLCAPFDGCNGGTTGWQVYTDDDGAPCELIAEFAHESEARWYCAYRSEMVVALSA